MSLACEQLLTTDDIARILRKSVHSIRHDLTRNPRALPPRCALPGNNRALWRLVDVEAWLAAHVTPVASTPSVRQIKSSSPTGQRKKKSGAPTKAMRIQRREEAAAAERRG